LTDFLTLIAPNFIGEFSTLSLNNQFYLQEKQMLVIRLNITWRTSY